MEPSLSFPSLNTSLIDSTKDREERIDKLSTEWKWLPLLMKKFMIVLVTVGLALWNLNKKNGKELNQIFVKQSQ